MDQLTLRPRKAVEPEPIENWDDDDLDIGGDDLTFRSASIATTATSQHRDSISSRLSFRSDFDSNHGDEEKQVHVPGDDERSTNDAIATATRAGIPIPQNVPASALLGGTIKRLGGRKIKKMIQEDWEDGDLELPMSGGLQIKRQDGSNFPDALRQVSGPTSTPASPSRYLQPAPKFDISPRPALKPKMASNNLLDRFRDEDENDDFFGDGGDTIKVSKSRQTPKSIALITPPTPQKDDAANFDDDFETDLQLPSNTEPLKLSTRRAIPQTPAGSHDDFDEWGEGGSLGTRHGGKRDRNSNRSSSSALSPSVSSSLTIESEDEGLDGLILPTGPIAFDDILKRRQQDRSPDHQPPSKQAVKATEAKEDFLAGLEIGDGDVFDSSKLTLNRNIKLKTTRQTSPTRPKTAVSLTFTNKPAAAAAGPSRLPRPLTGHERTLSSLEPVSESGGPIVKSARRSQSRLGGHSAQSSITSIATPTTPSSTHSLPPSTPRRRDLGQKPSITALRNEPTTTNAQLLKLKRSMPTMRSYPQSPAKPVVSRYERPPSRTDGSRPNSMSRPKTPLERDRSGAESSLSMARKNPVPFLPAGNAGSQSHHVTIKTSRHFRRHDSESSNTSLELRPSSRAVSRTMMRSPSPKRNPRGAEVVRDAAVKRQITKPLRRRHFGDGCELDGFDDLPTSRDTERQFVKEPVGRGPPKQSALRNKIHQEGLPSRTTTPAPLTPYSPARARDELPRFARDTNASRMAREHSLAQRAPSAQGGAPLAVLSNQWRSKVAATTGLSNVHAQGLKPKKTRGPPQKPQLIKPLGNLNNAKSVKGMYYNPHTYRWEGNENDLSSFDAPASSPSTASIPSHYFREKETQIYREKENSTPRPALIQNVNSCQNVQVVGGMVFDPQRMCWLKMPTPNAASGNGKSDAGDTMDGFDAFDDEEDVFKDVPDLEDKPAKDGDGENGGRKSEGASGLKDEWLVGEEFDVGPEFVKRQREEEDRWRRKCERWVGTGLDRGGDQWRWSIRDVVNH